MNGKILRGRIDAFNDVLTDVESFLTNKNKLDPETKGIIDNLAEGCEDLFYRIPLEKG